MPIFAITFADKYRTEAHPVSDVEPDGFVRVSAANRHEAHQRAYSVFSAYYQDILSEDELAHGNYPLGELYSL